MSNAMKVNTPALYAYATNLADIAESWRSIVDMIHEANIAEGEWSLLARETSAPGDHRQAHDAYLRLAEQGDEVCLDATETLTRVGTRYDHTDNTWKEYFDQIIR